MRQSAVEFESGGQPVQAVLAMPPDGRPPFAGVVVCHGHPLFGGRMDSPLTYAMCRSLAAANIASLRFDFRPFGEHASAPGGSAYVDIEAAWETLRAVQGIRRSRCEIAGVSAGAAAICRALDILGGVRAAALIAPPLSAVMAAGPAGKGAKRLFIVGDEDRLVDATELERHLGAAGGQDRLFKVPGAGHSLQGREQVVAETVAAFMAENLRG
jgi:alpha/beta superfamily hydrolase